MEEVGNNKGLSGPCILIFLFRGGLDLIFMGFCWRREEGKWVISFLSY